MYRIPKGEGIIEALEEIFSRNNEITSIGQLKFLVLKELKKKDSSYRISNARLLKTIADLGWIRIHVKKAKSRKSVKNCFICGTKMKPENNLTLTGKKIALGLKCPFCKLKLSNPYLKPAKYAFYRKGPKEKKNAGEKK